MKSVFTIHTANEWLDLAAKEAASASLYKNLWHEGETVCLKDKPRTGKSALALDIADGAAKTRSVLFIDFASTARIFALRNRDRSFSPNLRRLEVRRDALDDAGPDVLMEKIEEAVKESGIKVCVIDSLTWLCDYFRRPDSARRFMRAIEGMARRLGLSVLVVAESVRRIEPYFDNVFSVSDTRDPVGTDALFTITPMAGGEPASAHKEKRCGSPERASASSKTVAGNQRTKYLRPAAM